MISSVGTNSLQLINALKAFDTKKPVNTEIISDGKQNIFDKETSSGINLSDNDSLLNKVDMGEIKNYAQKIGGNNLTDEDIKYGLTYGRSVIADFLA